ncbi:MAG: transporter [Burkholderiales bacterium]
MTRRVLTLAFVAFAALPALARAQSDKLAHLLPTLYGVQGLSVNSNAPLPDGSTHSAHFNNAFQSRFNQFNAALASQLSALPLPSPSSGFTYTMDPTLGVFTRSTQSFGPIMAERAETMGKGKFAFGFGMQHFSFDTIDSIDLDALPAVFTHDDPAAGGRADVVTTSSNIQATVTQNIAFATYGLSDSIDVSLALPIVSADIDVVSDATIQRLGTGSNLIVHFYEQPDHTVGSTRQYVRSGHASGIGDLTLRFKGRVARWGSGNGLALGLDTRMPTGDEQDLLGSGAWGLRPFAAASWQFGKVSPHLNFGYQWNGDSLLAGDITTGTKGNLPDELLYAGGFDLGVTRRLTLAADVIGRYLIDTSRVETTTFHGLDNSGTSFPDIRFEQASYNETSVALGLKLNPVGRLLVVFNVLLKVDDHGLRDKAAPLLALDYTF